MPPKKSDEPKASFFDERLPLYRDHPHVKEVRVALDDDRFTIDMSLLKELRLLLKAAQKDLQAAAWMKQLKDAGDLRSTVPMFGACQRDRCRIAEIIMSFVEMRQALYKLWVVAEVALVEAFSDIATVKPEKYKDKLLTVINSELSDRRSNVDTILETARQADETLKALHFTLKEVKEVGIAQIEAEKAQRY